MFKRSASEAFHWVRDCLGIFRQNPAMWMLVALSYVLLFMVIPAMVFLPVIVKLLVVIMGPFFLVLALTLYREADYGRDTEFSDIVAQVKPQLGKLVALGGACMVYGILISYVTSGDMQALDDMVNAKADAEALATRAVPLAIKMLVLMTPIFMSTWFAPMLVAHHQFSVWKAIKSSIAGCLTSVLSLAFAWILLTAGLALCMMATGIVVALVTAILKPVGLILTSLTLLAFLLLATSLMLGLQYVSYRDIFAKKLDANPLEHTSA
jgi:hypothetical protein